MSPTCHCVLMAFDWPMAQNVKKGIGTFGLSAELFHRANSHDHRPEESLQLSQLPKQLKASAIDRRA